MRVEVVQDNKTDFMDVLLLAGQEEEKIEKYLEHGELYALYDDEVLRAVCVVVMLNNRKCELKNLSTIELDRNKGYGGYLMDYVSEVYSSSCDVMYTGVYSDKDLLDFYKDKGFENSHISPSFFNKYYDQQSHIGEKKLSKMVFLKKILESEVNVKRVVDLALKAGELLLKNGGEIFRVEETMSRICNRFYVDKIDTFIISHGIFISVRNGENDAYTRVRHVPLSSANLGVVTEVNDLSRSISSGEVDLDKAFERLDKIEEMKPPRNRYLVLASGLGAGFFGYTLGATMLESVIAGLIGIILYCWVLFAKNHGISKIIINIAGGALITILALLAAQIPFEQSPHIGGMIIGGIMPLIPGIAFINAIRDIADSDFLSGTVRMIDALLVFVYIAIGVGFILSVYSNVFGGIVI
ncbi:MAG: threonine/serine exporter ThrE family protein [Suipraeoptans sp.]